MLDTLTSLNGRDFNQRYGNTFGWLVKDDGKKSFVFLHGTDSRMERIDFSMGTTMQYHAKKDTGVTFEFIPVDRAWVNGEDGPYFLSRHPTRQWKRGIASTNTSIKDGKFRSLAINYETLVKIYNDNYQERNYSKEFKEGALSKHFALCGKDLWFYDKRVGKFDPKMNEIVLSDSIIYQEISDLFNRNGWNTKITKA